MKIRMLTTVPGSIDGIRVKTYDAGTEHDLSASPGARDLAKALVNARMAVALPPDPAQQEQEQPASAGFFAPVDAERPDGPMPGEQVDGQGLDPVAEEKAIEAAPENKMIKRAYNRKAK